MQATEKLYFTDSDLLEFPATVLDVQPAEQAHHVILDRTAFYPTGGGQPHDTGWLGDSRVIDVFEDDGGLIHHVVEQAGDLTQGQTVQGRIDRARRLDHLQQHSGQHILSQAFVQTHGVTAALLPASVQTSRHRR